MTVEPPPEKLTVTASRVGPAAVLSVHGTLDTTTYLPLRDSIIRAALEQPRGVVIDIAELQVPTASALAAFTSARWHVKRWPEVPILLACGRADDRESLTRTGTARHVPVYASVPDALDVLAGATELCRRRARAELPADWVSLTRSRELVAEWLTAWSHSDLVPVAKVVVTAFVENVLKHTDSRPALRVETDGAKVTVAVADFDRAPPRRHEEPTGSAGICGGLQVVTALTRMWGTAPTPAGKTVWAVIGRENRL
jgi:hypothetical protein